jgi:cytidylate kinase
MFFKRLKKPSLASPIAIDGPVASGKSTVGLKVAKRLGYVFLDTGLMYRSVTLLALERQVPLSDASGLARIAQTLPLRLGEIGADGAPPRVYLDGRDVTKDLVSPSVDRAVSQVSAVPAVREALVQKQRELAQAGRIVMIGRDIGTVVLPDAPLKVYLVASAEERSRRRYEERRQRGEQISYEAVLNDLKRRDTLDTERATSPLKPASDARHVDTDGRTIEQVVDAICALAGNP